MIPQVGNIRVWWVTNPPHEGERYPVNSVKEAIAKLDELAKRDLNMETVIANVGGLEQLEADGQWYEYYDTEDRAIDEIMEAEIPA